MCWSHAKVIDVAPNAIKVSYLNDKEKLNKYVNVFFELVFN